MEKIEFSGTFVRYIKSEVAYDQDIVKLKSPNTIMGFIPIGSKSETLSIQHISSVEMETGVKIGYFVLALLLGLFGFMGFVPDPMITFMFRIFWIIFCYSITAVLVISAFNTWVVINETSGRVRVLSFVIFDRAAARQLTEKLNEILALRTQDTNVRMQTDRSIESNRQIGEKLFEKFDELNETIKKK